MPLIAQGMLAYIEQRDHRLMRKVHAWNAPRWIRLWMVCATRGGDGWLWALFGTLLVLFGGEAGRLATAQSTLGVALGIAIFLKMKKTAGRRRPCALQPHCWSTLLPPDQFSFPSGHTITAFAVCYPLMQHYPDAAPMLLFCALSVASSRIILGMHFLSDVVAGGVIGSLIGYLMLHLIH
jgi:undecaprenyl-diphosphatase